MLIYFHTKKYKRQFLNLQNFLSLVFLQGINLIFFSHLNSFLTFFIPVFRSITIFFFFKPMLSCGHYHFTSLIFIFEYFFGGKFYSLTKININIINIFFNVSLIGRLGVCYIKEDVPKEDINNLINKY